MESGKFTEQVVPMGKKLYRFALSYLKDGAEAEDAVQEVMIKLWNRRESLGEYRSLEAFAMTVTRNHCLDKLRSRRTVSMDTVPVLEKNEHPSGNPQDKLEIADHVEVVRRMMNELPDQQQEILRLRDMEGFEFEEISEITGMNVNLIRVNLSRARKKIRETLINQNSYGMEKAQRTAGKILRG